jgi:opacity protein-like surface antigen
MARSLIACEVLVALALSSGAASSALAATPLLAANTVIQPGAADYDIGFRDALNKQPYRDAGRKNVRYGEGFNAGTAKAKAVAAQGVDYDLGYRDGYNKVPYRDATRRNVRYGEGYKAGGADHVTPTVAAPPPVAAAVPGAAALPAAARAAAGPDYDLGYRDAINKQPSRDASRKNVRYGEGYAAGQTKRESIAASGPDYELGFRDGFNKATYRDAGRKNKRYAEGFSAGQSERTAAVAPVPPPKPATQFEGLEPGRIVIDR